MLNLFKGELQAISSMVSDMNSSHGILEIDTSEGTELSKETIIAQVESMNAMLGANQKQLNDLRSRLKSSSVKNTELENSIKAIEERLAQRESQIAELMQMLADKDVQIQQIIATVDSMRSANINLTDQVVSMDQSMHEVFYTIGEAKELKERGLVTKDGGLLGLGGSKKMDVSQLQASEFKKADKRELKSIPLFSKKAKLISNHPEGSYEIKLDASGMAESLEIKDAERFWMAGAYCVVEVSN